MTIQTAIRVPAFNGSPPADRRCDLSTEGGAKILADRIARSWALLGGIVKTWTEPVAGTAGIGGYATSWAVRSDMVNGLPRAWRTNRIATTH